MKNNDSSFSILGNWLVWKVGRGERIRIGKVPWVDSGNEYKLSKTIINILHNEGIFSLAQATSPETFFYMASRLEEGNLASIETRREYSMGILYR